MMKCKKTRLVLPLFLLVNFLASPLETSVLFLIKSGYFINSSEEVLEGLKMIG